MSAVPPPRRVGDFMAEFEFWPLEADPEALTIAQHRPPGYFECDDIFVPSPQALVEQGLQRAVEEWKAWEASHPEAHLFRLQRFLRLPDGFSILGPDDDEEDGEEEEEEEEEGVKAGRKRKAPGAATAASGVGGGEEEEEEEAMEVDKDKDENGAAASASLGAPQEEVEEKDETAASTERGKAGGVVGGHPGASPPPPPPAPRNNMHKWERALANGGGGGGQGNGSRTAVERAAQLGPDPRTLRSFLRHMPNYATARRALRRRMLESPLALCKWKKRLDGADGGKKMKDYKHFAYIRRPLNVIVPPERLTTAEEAGAFAIGAEETLVVCSMFVPQNWTLHHYQDYTLLARNTLEHLHMVMYCSLSSILAVEGRAGRLPPELIRPSLAFFFIEHTFYVTERGEAGAAQGGPPDYVDAIVAWLDEPGQDRRAQLGIPPHAPLEIKDMAQVTLGELSLRLGTRYLYSHLGNCEHAFIISDLRLPGPEDDRDARTYPMLSFQKHYRKRRCAICDARPGQYVAIRDPLGDEARSVYCEFCHFQLHYDGEGHLLHEGFEVFPYLHDE